MDPDWNPEAGVQLGRDLWPSEKDAGEMRKPVFPYLGGKWHFGPGLFLWNRDDKFKKKKKKRKKGEMKKVKRGSSLVSLCDHSALQPQANFRSLNTSIASGPRREGADPATGRLERFPDCPWLHKIQTTLNQNIFGELIQCELYAFSESWSLSDRLEVTGTPRRRHLRYGTNIVRSDLIFKKMFRWNGA